MNRNPDYYAILKRQKAHLMPTRNGYWVCIGLGYTTIELESARLAYAVWRLAVQPK